ncbi:hypothetical protein KR044_010575 [Drosophila immigrans]|nr:hypothetical protein KR044_010575 [Drosophila immigrans]
MLLNKSLKHCAVAAIVMGAAVVALACTCRGLEMLSTVVCGMQATATGALLFAIFKKDLLHKDKLMLFWMGVSTFLETSLAIWSFEFISVHFKTYTFGYFIGSLFGVIGQWLAFAVVGCAIFIMYQEYVELTQINRAGLTLPRVANEIHPIYETKETPPPYIVPTSQNLTVSVQS